MSRRPIGCALLVLSLSLAGCQSGRPASDRPEPVPARGVVTYQGKPVADASVSFQSLDGQVSSWGTTDAGGNFVLSTYGEHDGVPPGSYRVVVSANTAKEIEPGVLAPEPDGGWKLPIPLKYADPDATDLRVEVTRGGKNEFTIQLK